MNLPTLSGVADIGDPVTQDGLVGGRNRDRFIFRHRIEISIRAKGPVEPGVGGIAGHYEPARDEIIVSRKGAK